MESGDKTKQGGHLDLRVEEGLEATLDFAILCRPREEEYKCYCLVKFS